MRSFQVAIVLAEPGGGKTAFLDSVAAQTRAVRKRASLFKAKEDSLRGQTLILDAMDEVTRLDASALASILNTAIAAAPARVLIACRAGIWEAADTLLTEQGFGTDAKVYHLVGFTRPQQTQIVEAHFPSIDAEAFFKASAVYDFESLLANPQLLRIFAGAFLQSGGRITSKRQAYRDAVEHMAQEKNEERTARGRRNYKEIIAWYEAVSARLLLSGCIGVAVKSGNANKDFPFLDRLQIGDKQTTLDSLETQLFKAAAPDQHEVSHRTVAEFCAARHLVSRVEDAADLISLNRCLSLIAPNGICRDELKGLLGWMAALGGPDLQRRLIDLDPYAVLSNGDASQLCSAAKAHLLHCLSVLADDDPLFRRSDGWRTFHAPGFFSEEMAPSILPYLAADSDPHLRSLILELMLGSQLTPDLHAAIAELVQNPSLSGGERRLALEVTKALEAPQQETVFARLVEEGSDGSLSTAAYMAEENGFAPLNRDQIRAFLLKAAGLYRANREDPRNTHTTLYKIEKVLSRLSLEDTSWLLNDFAPRLTCDCPPERMYDCFCRNGLSHIVTFLLDRFFSLSDGPFDPKRIWSWCRGLVLQRDINRKTRPSIEKLRSDENLRQAIHRLALNEISDSDVLRQCHYHWFMSGRGHAGLYFQGDDYQAILDHAFETENTVLWREFLVPHFHEDDERGPNLRRRRQREQAREKPKFAPVLAVFERERRARRDPDAAKHRRRMRRRRREDEEVEADNNAHLIANRKSIERGEHWGWLKIFANRYLIEPSRLEEYEDGREIAEQALANCVERLSSKAPNLRSMALEGGNYISRVLYAGCMVRFRRGAGLDALPKQVLWALHEENHGYDAVDEKERDALNAELEQLLFRTEEDLEHYLREFVEPPLELSKGRSGNTAWILEQPMFEKYRSTKPLIWLETYPDMPDDALNGLVNLAAQYGDREQLVSLIESRARAAFAACGDNEDESLERAKQFWAIRAYYFLSDPEEDIVEFLFRNKENVFWFRNLEDFGRRDRAVWPQLPPQKILQVLNAFAPDWPPVPLSSPYGSHSPNEQKAYRFLRDFVWQIETGRANAQQSVLSDLLANQSLEFLHVPARNMRAKARRKLALQAYAPPDIEDVVSFLDHRQLASVEDLRALFVDEMDRIQRDLRGGDTDMLELFYIGEERVDENTASKRLIAVLRPRFQSLGLSVVLERQLHAQNRCDITATFILNGEEITLVIEVKGQWHDRLYYAAAEQLDEKYAIYPGAADQGIYLVLWFGHLEEVAGRRRHQIESANSLRSSLAEELPESLRPRLDLVVLDLSR